MNKSLFFLIVVTMILFSACKKDAQISVVIEATNVTCYRNDSVKAKEFMDIIGRIPEDDRSDIATVKAIIYYSKKLPDGKWDDGKYTVASSIYKNNSFKLDLPAVVPDKYLHLINVRVEEKDSITFNDINAREANVFITAYASNGNELSSLKLENDSSRVSLLYIDRDFIAYRNGKVLGFPYKKGWNFIYQCGSRIVKITTCEELDEDYKWYY